MFLVAGIIAGPSVLGIVHSHQKIELLANIGIALLLFVVGLKLDLNLIKKTGPVALATGLGQIIFTSIAGFIIARVMGTDTLTSAYIAVALTFSSTIIIVKLLSDKKEIDSLHGQIAIGFLIVQDIAAILALVGLTTFGSSITIRDAMLVTDVTMLQRVSGFLFLKLFSSLCLPKLTKRLAKSMEMLTLMLYMAIFMSA
jgi:Kef-type K+ transport system membrane component KefB